MKLNSFADGKKTARPQPILLWHVLIPIIVVVNLITIIGGYYLYRHYTKPQTAEVFFSSPDQFDTEEGTLRTELKLKGLTMATLSPTQAQVSWRTHPATQSVLEYSLEKDFATVIQIKEPQPLQRHRLLLEDLPTDSRIYLRIQSQIGAETPIISKAYNFKTQGP